LRRSILEAFIPLVVLFSTIASIRHLKRSGLEMVPNIFKCICYKIEDYNSCLVQNYINYALIRNFIDNDKANQWKLEQVPKVFTFTTNIKEMSTSNLYLGSSPHGIFEDIEKNIQNSFYKQIFQADNHIVDI
jgi:hypothetical protein